MDIHIPIPDWSAGWVVAFMIYAVFTFTFGYVVSRITHNSRLSSIGGGFIVVIGAPFMLVWVLITGIKDFLQS